MKLSRQQLLVVIVLVVLGFVVGVAGLLLAVLPQQSQAKRLDAEIAATQAKLVTLERNHHGPVIRAAQLFQLARAMPDSADMPGLILELSRAAQDSKVSLLSVQPSGALVQPDGSSGLPLKLEMTGSWSGIAAFLHALRSNVRVNGGKLSVDGRLFTVDNFELTPNAAPPPSSSSTPSAAPSLPQGELTVSLSVNAFSYGTAPAPVPTTTSTDGTTTTSSPSGSVQAAGSTG